MVESNQALVIIGGIFAFFLFFSILWSSIVFLISRLSGWATLANYYATTNREFEGKLFRFRSGSFGFQSNYSGIMHYGISKSELFLDLFVLYRIGHAPLRIPLEEIHAQEKTFIFPLIELTFDRAPRVRLRIRKGFAEQLIAESSGRLVVQKKGPEA